MGVIDGHDVRPLRAALRQAFEAERPVVVHVATVKGKGFAPAEEGGLEGMEKWHAAKPKSIAKRMPAPAAPKPKDAKPAPPQYTQVFGEALVRECHRDERVVGITAAMNSGTGLSILQKALPERYFDVGIAEQQAVLFASGLAIQGARPVVAIYSTFLQRAYDQIVHDVCLQSLPVVFCMDRAGLVGDDGPTHHGAFDIAYLRCLPNITLMAPRDEAMLVNMLHTALRQTRPGRDPLPARRGRRRRAARPSRSGSRSAPARSCARASASRSSATAPASARRSAPPTSSPRAASTSPSPTPASPSRSTPACSRSSPPSTTCSSPSRKACSTAASAPASGRRCRRAGGAAHPARRPARPLRDPRRAEAAPRGGRLHGGADRRADRVRRAGPARLARLRVVPRLPGISLVSAAPTRCQESQANPSRGGDAKLEVSWREIARLQDSRPPQTSPRHVPTSLRAVFSWPCSQGSSAWPPPPERPTRRSRSATRRPCAGASRRSATSC